MTTRAEHMAWCKKRALQELDTDNPANGIASMFSDLGKHPETAGHIGIQMGAMLMVTGSMNDTAKVREFIGGFN